MRARSCASILFTEDSFAWLVVYRMCSPGHRVEECDALQLSSMAAQVPGKNSCMHLRNRLPELLYVGDPEPNMCCEDKP